MTGETETLGPPGSARRSTAEQPMLVGQGLSKGFDGHVVLSGVDITVRAGQVHALLGANGSGKSTLVKILAGNHVPDAGTMELDGHVVPPVRSPAFAWAHGMRVVHQEAPLINSLRISESIALVQGFGVCLAPISWRSLARHAKDVLAGLDIDPQARAGSLSPAERALVSVAIALWQEPHTTPAKILILDEASAALPAEEARRLLAHVRELAQDGLAVLMVTHRLKEVSEFADELTVLNDGRVNYSGSASLPREEMVELITRVPATESRTPGRSRRRLATLSDSLDPSSHRVSDAGDDGDRGVTVENLSTPRLDDVSFRVDAGTIVGIVGGPDSGVEEIPTALAGALVGCRGFLEIGGRRQPLPRSPSSALRRGIALVPRDRLHEGAVPSLSARDNILLPQLGRYWHKPSASRALVEGVMEDFDIRPNKPDMLIRTFSGGNQQKVIVGKWLTCCPKLLLLDDPTIGVDPGSRTTMFAALRSKIRQMHTAVLLLSSEPEQLVEVCDRVVAIGNGKVVEDMTGDQISYAKVARWTTA